MDDVVTLITANGIVAIYPILFMTVLRPFGLLMGFLAFSWAMRGAQMLRIAIAIALTLPVMAGNAPAFERLISLTSVTAFLPIAMKELIIGYGLGLLASLPFFALQYAGAITDAFRGESDTGNPDPTGGTLHTFSTAYLVIGFFAFFSLGGFEALVRNLYRTYDIWPLDAGLPNLDSAAALRAGDMLTSTLMTTFVVALPLLAMLVVIELSMGIAARLGRRFNLYDMAFPIKNLVTVLTLPLIMWVVWQVSATRLIEAEDAFPMLQGLFR